MIKRVLKIIVGVFYVIKDRYREMLKASLLPIIVLMGLSFIDSSMVNEQIKHVFDLVLFFIECIVYTTFAVTIHRVVLLGEGSVPKWGTLKWTVRELRFFLHLLGVYLISLVLGLIVFNIPQIFDTGSLTFFIPIYLIYHIMFSYYSGRISLVFPANSIDQKLSFKGSWKQTQDHQLFMFLVILIVPIVYITITILPILPLLFASNSIIDYFLPAYSIIILTVVVVSLSLAYLDIAGRDSIISYSK